jgi:hypothetical protein
MLDVIGAGATATVDRDWHEIWKSTPECTAAQEEVDRIVSDGQKKPPVQEELHSEYATNWGYQVSELCKRGFLNAWRDPTYLMAKLVLNICGGCVYCMRYANGDLTHDVASLDSLLASRSSRQKIPFKALKTNFS